MLWLLRHGDAAAGHPDEARPLTPRGREQAQNAGAALRRLGAQVDACLSSPKARALQTAELACAPLAVEVSVERLLAQDAYDPELLGAGLGDVLLVGHNPALSRALHHLTGARVNMRKGALAAVSGGELVLLLGPRELAAIAGGQAQGRASATEPTPGGSA
jgi:phosphohistidine phosphatase